MIHYMIDIETLGQGPESMVLSIAAVKFDQDQVLKSIELYPDLTEQQLQGQKIEVNTLEWWINHKEILSTYLQKHEKTEEVRPDGESITKTKTKVTHNRVRTHPALTARNQCWANIMKGLQECGLTPSTRSKLKIVKKEETNPFAALLSGS